MGLTDHLTCFLRNLYTGQEAQLELDMEQQTGSKLRNEFAKAVYCPPACLFNLQAEYFMWNARLAEAQAGIKIAGRNINSFRYAEDTTLMAESEVKLKNLLMKVKSESEVAQSYPTLSDPMDCSLPGSSTHGIIQARVPEWGAIAFSRCTVHIS